MPMFTFQERWKEELVCTGPGGRFVIQLSMGILSAYLPTEAEWKQRGPVWARDLWPQVKAELEQWCIANKAQFFIEPNAFVYE